MVAPIDVILPSLKYMPLSQGHILQTWKCTNKHRSMCTLHWLEVKRPLWGKIEEGEKPAVTRNSTHNLLRHYSALTTLNVVLNAYPAATWCVLCVYNLLPLQSAVVIPLLLWMVLLIHIKTQLRELRYSSDVTQGLSQLGGWQQCVHQIGGGTLTLLVMDVHVRVHTYSVLQIGCSLFCHVLQQLAILPVTAK